MKTLVIELPTTTYERLRERAEQAGITPEALSRELLEAALEPTPTGPETTEAVLRAAGLLTELSPALRARIVPGVTLEQVRAALTRANGPSLSEIVLAQRGPKE
jgi:hypothetical protein